MISDVNIVVDERKFKELVVCLWKQHVHLKSFQLKSVDMVLMDDKVSTCHSRVFLFLFALTLSICMIISRKPYHCHYREGSNSNVLEIVKWGKYVCFSNFFIGDNLAHFKMVDHVFKISFHKNTFVKAMTSSFPNGLSSLGFPSLEKLF